MRVVLHTPPDTGLLKPLARPDGAPARPVTDGTAHRRQRIVLYALALAAAGAFFLATTSLIGWFMPPPATVDGAPVKGH